MEVVVGLVWCRRGNIVGLYGCWLFDESWVGLRHYKLLTCQLKRWLEARRSCHLHCLKHQVKSQITTRGRYLDTIDPSSSRCSNSHCSVDCSTSFGVNTRPVYCVFKSNVRRECTDRLDSRIPRTKLESMISMLLSKLRKRVISNHWLPFQIWIRLAFRSCTPTVSRDRHCRDCNTGQHRAQRPCTRLILHDTNNIVIFEIFFSIFFWGLRKL